MSSGGTVYLGNGPNEVVAVDASTGVIRWTSEVVDVENKLAVNQLALVGGELVVPYVEEAWSSPWAPGSGGVARLDPATGAVLGRQPGEPAYAVAESGGTVAVERFGGLLASGRRVDWAFRGGAAYALSKIERHAGPATGVTPGRLFVPLGQLGHAQGRRDLARAPSAHELGGG